MRRAFAIALLSGAALLFAFRFAPPPEGTLEGEGEIVVEPTEPLITTTTFSLSTSLPPPTTTTLPLGPGIQVVAGPMVQTSRGFVQVEITVFDGVMTNIEMIKVPQESRRAKTISLAAHAELREEALELQGFRLHNVSGATETTRAYIKSLREALLTAGVISTR